MNTNQKASPENRRRQSKGDSLNDHAVKTIIPNDRSSVKPCGGQCARVLRHLQDYGSITAMDAVKEYGIMRLAARVSDLKKLGYAIESKFETAKNRYGESVNYVRYYFVKEDIHP